MNMLDIKVDILYKDIRQRYRHNKKRQFVINTITEISNSLKDLQIKSNRLKDINTIISNNETSIDIMNNEVSNKKKHMNQVNDNFLIENYKLNELNENETKIDILNDNYSKKIKYLIILFLILIVIYYIIINL